ncbi:MAG TPA: TlpA disulfide reductase family protein [Bacteroidia bacterium]|nr:TlpA disulfide reductase family protein [Bacteroidia bacterium]
MKKVNIILLVVAAATLTFGFIYSKSSEAQTGTTVGTAVGNKAPELKFKDPEGKELALSSYRGNIVLVDFWASWCRPCRMENPNVVAAYAKYKNAKFKNAKGFIVYSVSLDQQHDAWVNAIKQDNLSWTTQVSDLGGWQSKPAAIYGVQSIPTNFLLDSKGVIIDENLRGEALDMALDKLLKK